MAAILTLLLLFPNGSNGRTRLATVQSRRRKYCNFVWVFQSHCFYVKNRSTESSKVVMLSYNAYSFGPSVMKVFFLHPLAILFSTLCK
uniref:Putative secreted peptide n=1 Tax=Anopheles braziliensis TaxID=58242 RepID=A0A2M3ZPK5_9DIPT